MAALLPETLLLFYLEDRLVLNRLSGGLVAGLRLREQKVFPLGENSSLADVLRQIKDECQPRADDTILLGLPLRYFNLVQCHLPLAAVDNLEEAVRYELVRHIPYDLSSVYLNYVSRVDDDGLRITATVAPKAPVGFLLDAFADSGMTLSIIFPSLVYLAWKQAATGIYLAGGRENTELVVMDDEVVFHAWEKGTDPEAGKRLLRQSRPLLENLPISLERFWLWQGDVPLAELASELEPLEGSEYDAKQPVSASRPFASFPHQVNLVPVSVLKRRKFMFWLQAAALLFFLFSLFSLPLASLAGKRAHLRRLEAKLTEIRQHAEELSTLRQKNQAIIDQLQGVARYVKAQPIVVDLLKEVTEAVPTDAWLKSLVITERQVRLSGSSPSATTIIEALEASPLFKEAKFDSPVVKRGTMETFKIVATLE